MEERFIRVGRTARFHQLGDPQTAGRLWVVVHGYGQLARYFLNAFAPVAGADAVVAPEGLSRFYLDDAHQRVGATWMTREDRLHEIDDHVAYLDALCDELRKHAMPGARICALGFSQGVATLMRWAVQGRTDLNRIVLWGGSLPPDLDGERLKARLSNAAVHLVHGNGDDLVPMEAMHDGAQLLRRHGVKCTTDTFDGGHELDSIALSEALTGNR